MEQTFDAALLVNKSIPDLTATAGYIGNVQTVNSTTDTLTAPFANLNYKLGEFGNAVVYGYWIDYDDPAKYAYYNADKFSTDTQKLWIEGVISF